MAVVKLISEATNYRIVELLHNDLRAEPRSRELFAIHTFLHSEESNTPDIVKVAAKLATRIYQDDPRAVVPVVDWYQTAIRDQLKLAEGVAGRAAAISMTACRRDFEFGLVEAMYKFMTMFVNTPIQRWCRASATSCAFGFLSTVCAGEFTGTHRWLKSQTHMMLQMLCHHLRMRC